LLEAARVTRQIEIERFGAAMVAEETNLWLVVGERNLPGLRAEGPRARNVKPCVESVGPEFLVFLRAAKEHSVAEPLKPVEEDRRKKSDERQKGEREDSCKDGWQAEGEKSKEKADYPEAGDNGEGIPRHVWLPV